jgi:hypothetical protein
MAFEVQTVYFIRAFARDNRPERRAAVCCKMHGGTSAAKAVRRPTTHGLGRKIGGPALAARACPTLLPEGRAAVCCKMHGGTSAANAVRRPTTLALGRKIGGPALACPTLLPERRARSD